LTPAIAPASFGSPSTTHTHVEASRAHTIRDVWAGADRDPCQLEVRLAPKSLVLRLTGCCARRTFVVELPMCIARNVSVLDAQAALTLTERYANTLRQRIATSGAIRPVESWQPTSPLFDPDLLSCVLAFLPVDDRAHPLDMFGSPFFTMGDLFGRPFHKAWASSLDTAVLVCKSWRDAAHDEAFWRKKAERLWPGSTAQLVGVNIGAKRLHDHLRFHYVAPRPVLWSELVLLVESAIDGAAFQHVYDLGPAAELAEHDRPELGVVLPLQPMSAAALSSLVLHFDRLRILMLQKSDGRSVTVKDPRRRWLYLRGAPHEDDSMGYTDSLAEAEIQMQCLHRQPLVGYTSWTEPAAETPWDERERLRYAAGAEWELSAQVTLQEKGTDDDGTVVREEPQLRLSIQEMYDGGGVVVCAKAQQRLLGLLAWT